MKLLNIYIIFFLTITIGCTAIEETSKHPMETGIYKVSTQNKRHFYTVVEEDTIKLHPVTKTKGGWIADTTEGAIIHINSANPYKPKIKFSASSFDLDVMTILFKYRPYTAGFPNNHFAFSLGGFAGLGATTMNPFVTNNNLLSEYDGVLLTKGFAGLVGVGDFTFGAGVGFDNLLDKNRKVWIYENKPWIGFTVGFNIN